MGEDRELARGRDAARRLAWADAYAALSLADRSSSLDGEDLELLATAAYLLGRVENGLRALRRAQQFHADRGDLRRAARCAFWLGFHLINQRELAQASGWLARANRLLEHEQECAEHGYLLLPVALRHFVAGDYAAARRAAARAAAIGNRVTDADLVTLALSLQGRAMVRAGPVGAGLGLLDEAMVAVVAGELSPSVTGTVYCSVIDACQEVLDWRRAHEWTTALAAWCGKQPAMVTFTGQCLVHRAEILQLHGAWPQAAEEAKRAGERLRQGADSYATGASFYRQAELYRVLGDFAAAEDAYQQASRWGLQPQPGLALLRLAQGRTDAAEAAIRRVVAETQEQFHRVRLLPAHAEIMLAIGDLAAAREAADELTGITERHDTPALRGVAGHTLGAVLLAEGDARAAAVVLRGAWQAWRELEAPHEAARVRVLVGLACRKTNHAIATDLVLAAKTIDRHVSNIYAKLGVSSRAAATAYAYQHRLL